MEDDRFVLFPRTQKGNVTWYYYVYDQNGKRWYRSTGIANKAYMILKQMLDVAVKQRLNSAQQKEIDKLKDIKKSFLLKMFV